MCWINEQLIYLKYDYHNINFMISTALLVLGKEMKYNPSLLGLAWINEGRNVTNNHFVISMLESQNFAEWNIMYIDRSGCLNKIVT